MKKNIKGVSAVVATVLIVMITVAAVGLLWAIIAPFLTENIVSEKDCMDVATNLAVDSGSAFTCSNTTDTSVRIERKADQVKLNGIQIKYEKADGTSLTKDFGPVGTNLGKVFLNNVIGNVTYVAIAPIVDSDGVNYTCDVGTRVKIARTC